MLARLRPLALCLIPVLAGLATAQQGADAAASKLDAVRTLHAEFAKGREEVTKLMQELRKAPRGGDEQKRLQEQLGKLRSGPVDQQSAFAKAFAACDWTRFDPKADAALLKDGLPGVARDLDAPAKAIAASRLFLQHFGDDRSAEMIRGNALPMALLCHGDAAEAKKLMQEAIDKATGPAKARAMLILGDVVAAGGDPAGAAKIYADAEAIADEGTMGYVTLRKELIGKPAPDIDSKTWLGGEAKALSSMKGKVVLVDFWATWCGPCRAVMPALNELYHQHQKDGLEVIGLTRFYANGYLPANQAQMQSGGESVKGMTEATFLPHVEAFKNNTGIDYPFVVGVEQDFKNYFVRGIPTLAVVGKDGNIALITVGSGSEGLLKYAVGQLLAKK